ncbi:MAG: hypothetical protein JNK04_17980 [Myxococcales bacterium]|nr:hypothetical protein [Myxococcales bacterium]
MLGTSLLVYGAVKVWKSQFPSLRPSDLELTYGESSPMGLLWRFMGQSTAYSIATGCVEIVGASLLFFRRTTLLGALLLTVAMTQVFLLNMCFDVSVKLWSGHLLVMSLSLLAPQARVLWRFFTSTSAVAQAPIPPLFAPSSVVGRRALLALKALVVAGWYLQTVDGARTAHATWGDGRQPLPLEGRYKVEHADVGDTCPEALPFQKLTIDEQGAVTFSGDGSRAGWKMSYDPEAGSLSLAAFNDDAKLTSVEGARVGPHDERLELAGNIGKRQVKVALRKLESRDSLLESRGFHWLNEVPFNR